MVRDRLGSGSVTWDWRRGLFAWEEDLVAELSLLLNRFYLDDHCTDRWSWFFVKDGVYSTGEGYLRVVEKLGCGLIPEKQWAALVWNKWSPPKINTFVWKLVQDRIPTLPNLKKRNC